MVGYNCGIFRWGCVGRGTVTPWSPTEGGVGSVAGGWTAEQDDRLDVDGVGAGTAERIREVTGTPYADRREE